MKAIADLFSELKWKYVPTLQDRKKLDVDGKLPDSAEKLLQQAIATQEKMSKTAMAILKSSLSIPDDLCRSPQEWLWCGPEAHYVAPACEGIPRAPRLADKAQCAGFGQLHVQRRD